MKFLSNIKLSLGSYTLKKRSKQIKRFKTVHNFNTARTAGIIFHCTGDNDFKVIKTFKKYLEQRQIEPFILGYINEKQVPDYFLLRQGFNCFCLKDISWIYIPSVPAVEQFLKKEFDVLFDLSTGFHFPIHYLVSLSTAQYKVGRFTTQTDFDLMIDISKDNNLAFFTEQVIHYLNIIQRTNDHLIEDIMDTSNK